MSALRPTVFVFLGLAACGAFSWEHAVRSEATDDLHCPDEQIAVTEESSGAKLDQPPESAFLHGSRSSFG